MAFTFDELFANAPPDVLGPTERWVADTFLTRIQEDGRVSYIESWLFLDHATTTLVGGINNVDPAFDVLEFFNDRARFTGDADRLGVVVSRVNATTCRVVRTLKSWGNVQEQVDLFLPNNIAALGKVYEGRGVTIGGGLGQAIWCMTFANLQRRDFPIG